MQELKKFIFSLSALMSVSGSERYDKDALTELIGPYFDEYECDPLGNHIFIKRCGREGAPKILIDAHFDEIGMLVTDIKEGGFLSVTSVGGLDTRILQACEVVIYGEEKLYGVVASTPPHLQKPGDAKKLKKVEELLIDTGYPKEELENIAPIGTPVGFAPKFTELLGGRIAGKGFDDKSCGACAAHAIAKAKKEELAGDVCLMLSSREEVGLVGARTGAFAIDPDLALVLDVNFARTPDTKKDETLVLGEGPSVSFSAVTDRRLTRAVIELAKEKGLKCQEIVEAKNTGTNGNIVGLTRHGIPTAVLSLPLKSMHTYSEVVSLDDAMELSKLVLAVITNEKIAKEFSR